MKDLYSGFAKHHDGYQVLFNLCIICLPYLGKRRPLNWGPEWTNKQNIFGYLNELQTKALDLEKNDAGKYTVRDIADEYLNKAYQRKDLRGAALTQMMKINSHTRRKEIDLLGIAVYLLQHSDAKSTAIKTLTIKKTEISTKPTRKPFVYRNKIQCRACQLFGHDLKVAEMICRISGQIYWVMQFMKTHKEEFVKQTL